MCLVLLGWQTHPIYSLVMVSNRDELYLRPAAPLGWHGFPGLEAALLCGLDKPSAGTWIGMSASGRVAAITNVRNGLPTTDGATRSRGVLVPEAIASEASPADCAADLAGAGGEPFGGFNLLVGTPASLWWTSNRSGGGHSEVTPGVHGLSNAAALDVSWPKVTGGVADFERVLAADDGSDHWIEEYLKVLADRRRAPRPQLPHTGVGMPMEVLLSPRFVRMLIYGTRSSTVLRMRHDGTFDMTERRFGWHRRVGQTTVQGKIVVSDSA